MRLTDEQVIIENGVYEYISTFYSNARNFHELMTVEDAEKWYNAALDSILDFEKYHQRRPILKVWEENGYMMFFTKTWYFAYKIEEGILHIYDTRYKDTLHESKDNADRLNRKRTIRLTKDELKNLLRKCINEAIYETFH